MSSYCYICVLILGEFVQRAAPRSEFAHLPPLAPLVEEGERVYLRSLAAGADAGKRPSHIHEAFPEVAQDVTLPHTLGLLYDSEAYHSSVLRVASGDTELWTHYDVMHNILIQVTGTKLVTLWPPSEDSNLYTEGSSSRVPEVHAPETARFPRFSRTHEGRVEALLLPGQAVFIPPLWFHHVSMPEFSVGINVFWRGAPNGLYNGKDIYGNKDLPQACAAIARAGKVGQDLSRLPEPFRSFYARRAAAQLLAEAGACGGEEMSVAFARAPAAAACAKTMMYGKVFACSSAQRLNLHITKLNLCMTKINHYITKLNLMYGKVCVVTGANRGIGRQTALALACRGATVVMACRDSRRAALAAAGMLTDADVC